MFLYIKASSKDQKMLEKFVSFLSKLETSSFVLKSFPKQNKRKFVTVLKSPHVNKTAQEQFEFRYYNKQFLINSFQPLIVLFFLKKIKNVSFSGVRLEVKILFIDVMNVKLFLKLMNPDNTVFDLKNKLVEKVSFNKYVQFFDLYGEIFLKNFSFAKL